MYPSHVAYVQARYPNTTETFIDTEIRHLLEAGHRVTVITLEGGDRSAANRVSDSVRIVVRPTGFGYWFQVLRGLSRVLLRHRSTEIVRAFLANPLRFWLAYQLSEIDADHVHVHFVRALAVAAARAAHSVGKACSTTAHAFDIYQVVHKAHLANRLPEFDCVATVTATNIEALRHDAPEWLPIQEVHCSVDSALFPHDRKTDTSAFRILTVARLIDKKGIDILIRALAIFLQSIGAEDCQLVVIGDGPQRRLLEALSAELKLGSAVTFLGQQPNDVVADELLRSSVFVLPCREAADGDRDGLPVAILEAMLAGVPVIATPVNGIAELINDGESGLLVAQEDPAALAAALHRLAISPDTRHTLARAGREAAVQWADPSTNTRALVGVFQTARSVFERRRYSQPLGRRQ